jgi:hypothetical protein
VLGCFSSFSIKIRVLTFPHEWGLIRRAEPPAAAAVAASFPFQNREEAAASCWQASQGFYEIFIEPCNHDIAVFLISSLIPAPNAAALFSTRGTRFYGGDPFAFFSCLVFANFFYRPLLG